MIVIKKSSTADTRTCDVTKVDLMTLGRSSIQHIDDVKEAIGFLCARLTVIGLRHDRDKITDITGFHRDFQTKFEQHEWWDNHKKISKHHLQKECEAYNEINLLDVIEHIVDCVMAGLGRAGKVYPIKINNELLQMAVENTVNLLIANTKVEE